MAIRAPGPASGELRFKVVSIAGAGTATVTAIEATQAGGASPSHQVQMATLQLISFGYCHGDGPRHCARTINCSHLEALLASGQPTAPSIEALCSYLVCELQALVVSRSPTSSPVTPCFSPQLSPGSSPLSPGCA